MAALERLRRERGFRVHAFGVFAGRCEQLCSSQTTTLQRFRCAQYADVHDAGFAGIRWASLSHPGLTNLVVFDPVERGIAFVAAEQLSTDHPAVVAAAERIVRHIET